MWMRLWFSTCDMRYETWGHEHVCLAASAVKSSVQSKVISTDLFQEGGLRLPAYTSTMLPSLCYHTCYIMVCNRTHKTLKLWWNETSGLWLNVCWQCTFCPSSCCSMGSGGQAPSQTRSAPCQSIQWVQQHFKTCLRGSGEEATSCKVLAERNGCLDTEPSSISLVWIHMCNFI